MRSEDIDGIEEVMVWTREGYRALIKHAKSGKL
jgi:hypothetical protein